MNRLTHDAFKPQTGTSFLARIGDVRVELILTEVELSSKHTDDFQPFVLLFEGSSDTRFGQQQVPMSHGKLGELSIFLVPVGEKEGRINYEAVFN